MIDWEVRKIILDGTLAERGKLLSAPPPDLAGYSAALATRRAQRAAREEGVISYDPAAWLGRTPTHAERVRFAREVRRLARDGEIELIFGPTGRRVIAIRLQHVVVFPPSTLPTR